MRLLAVNASRTQFLLTMPSTPEAESAACAAGGVRLRSTSDGWVVFGWPCTLDAAATIESVFAPPSTPEATALLAEMQQRRDAIAAAADAKITAGPLRIPVALKTTPKQHQVAAINFASTLVDAGVPFWALFMEQGTGKSLTTIALASWLAAERGCPWALVVVPNSLKSTWGSPDDGEIALHSGLQRQHVEVLAGSRAQKAEQLRDALRQARAGGRFLWAIVNYDVFSIDHIRSKEYAAFHDVARDYPGGLLVLDESSRVKNGASKRTRSLAHLSRVFAYRTILTGTPVTKAPLDVWSQSEILDPGALGFNSYLAFERAYAIRQTIPLAGRMISTVVGYRNLEDLERRVARFSFRARASECLDLPPAVHRTLSVELSPEQTRAIRQLKRQHMAELDTGLVDGTNVLTRYLRMRQVAGGFVTTIGPDDGPGPIHAFKPNPKLQALEEYLDLSLGADDTSKAVIFTEYRAEIDAIMGACQEWGAVAFHGDVTEADRETARVRFKTDPSCRVFVAQYQTGSLGLNLVEANIAVYFSLTFDLELFLQSQKRIHRMGQGRPVEYVYLVAEAGIDRLVLSALQAKKNVADVITGDARAAI